jgi:hypothetical protein
MTTMKAPKFLHAPRQNDLETQDLTQEIEAPLEDGQYRDQATLSRLDFEDIEIALDL